MATRTYTHSLFYNMFVLVFLLLARTGCDWVEISQNHYRKETSRQETVNINYEETTEAIIVYRNNSLLDKHWKKGVIDRVPSVANIRRVHVPNVKTTSMQTEDNIFNRQASLQNVPDRRYDSVIAKPNILSKYKEEEIPIDHSERIEAPYHINRGSSFERNSEPLAFHKAHIENTNKLSRTEQRTVNQGYVTNVKKENLNQDMGSVKRTYLKGSENNFIITTERTPQIIYQDEKKVGINHDVLLTGVIKEQLLPKDSKLKGFSNVVKPIVESLPIMEKKESSIKRPEILSEDKTSGAPSTHFINKNYSSKNKESIEYESNEEASISNSDGISNKTKASTMSTMWKLIRVVTDSIYRNTRKSFGSKINYLEGLKSNILSSIEHQVERTWPDDSARSSRRARDAAGRGHVEFPSSESALMSISFLTFAVFLIKLVLACFYFVISFKIGGWRQVEILCSSNPHLQKQNDDGNASSGNGGGSSCCCDQIKSSMTLLYTH